MIGRLDPSQKQVIIVGAGISGLLAADALDRQGYEVELLEAADRAGGLLRTAQTPYGIAEAAAHSILATPEVRAHFGRIGLPLEGVRKNAKARYILREGRLRKFPLTPFESLRAFARAYFVLAPKTPHPEELSAQQWAERFLGAAAARYAMDPFVRGIYGCRPEELRVGSAFPRAVVPRGHSLISSWLKSKREKNRKPRGAMVAPQGGMGAWVDVLEHHLSARLGARFKKNHPVHELPSAANLVLCVPPPAGAALLAAADPELSQALAQARTAPLASVTLFVRSAKSPLKGVGALFPECEKREALGILFNSSAFEGRVQGEGMHSYTVMLGGTARPEQVDLPEDALSELAARELVAIWGSQAAPPEIVHAEVFRWKQAIPLYDGALAESWELSRKGWCAKPGHVLFGNAFGQVSLRGMIESCLLLEPHRPN